MPFWSRGRADRSQEASVEPEDEESASEFCRRLIRGFQEKANHNKFEAQFFIGSQIIASLLATLLITLGEGYWFGKVFPAIASLAAAGATTWLQVRKPQQLWATYRNAQRELEDQHYRFRFKLSNYETAEQPEKVLAEHTTNIALSVHRIWMNLVPNPEALIGKGNTELSRTSPEGKNGSS